VVASREEPKRIADGRLPNVTSVPDAEWGLAPDSVDLIFTALNYHDVVNLKVDRPALLKNFMTILKPGGIFAVIDHSAEAGSGDRDVGTLHRIDEAFVVSVKAAGFEPSVPATCCTIERRTHAEGVRPGDPRQN
jgi:predicted methyltransferase